MYDEALLQPDLQQRAKRTECLNQLDGRSEHGSRGGKPLLFLCPGGPGKKDPQGVFDTEAVFILHCLVSQERCRRGGGSDGSMRKASEQGMDPEEIKGSAGFRNRDVRKKRKTERKRKERGKGRCMTLQ